MANKTTNKIASNFANKTNKMVRQAKRSIKHKAKDNKFCRLCGDAEISIDDNPRKYTSHEKELFNPCRCRTPAHRYCVKKWDTDKNNKNKGQCEVCGYVYERQVKRTYTCACPSLNEVMTRMNESMVIRITLIVMCYLVLVLGIFGYRADTYFGYANFTFTSANVKYFWSVLPEAIFASCSIVWIPAFTYAILGKSCCQDCTGPKKSNNLVLILLATIATFVLIHVAGWIVLIHWWIPHEIAFKSVDDDLKYHPNLLTFYIGLITVVTIGIAAIIVVYTLRGFVFLLKYIGTNVGKWCGQECRKCIVVKEITTDDLKECNVA